MSCMFCGGDCGTVCSRTPLTASCVDTAVLVTLRADLARVTAERDHLQGERDEARESLAKVRRDLDTMISVHDEVERERDALATLAEDRRERLREVEPATVATQCARCAASAERERCAAICDEIGLKSGESSAHHCANAIRGVDPTRRQSSDCERVVRRRRDLRSAGAKERKAMWG